MASEENGKLLKRLLDTQEIKDLHREYVYWVNDCEWDKVIDCFTEDCMVIIGKWGLRKGKAALQKLFKDDIGHNNKGKGRDGHFAIMPVIAVDGNRATGHWIMYIMIADPETGNSKKWAHGRHDVVYARVDDKWKIQSIVYTSPWPRQLESFPKVEELAQIGLD